MNICVFGAASSKIGKVYLEETEKLGYEIGKRGHNLVYGAGGSGVMGAVARGVKSGGGKVIGVIPTFFREETIEEIYYFMKDYLERNPLPDAFLMDTYHVSIGAIRALREKGIVFPEEVSLVGVDMLPPYLTGHSYSV